MPTARVPRGAGARRVAGLADRSTPLSADTVRTMATTERGWSSDSARVARYRVVARLNTGERGMIPTCSMVAEALELPVPLVVRVVGALHAEGLAKDPGGLVPESGNAWLTGRGQAVADQWHAAQSSRRQRNIACRDALLDWLYEQPVAPPDASGFLDDQRGRYFGSSFSAEDAEGAMSYLIAEELVTAIQTAEALVLRPALTSTGGICVEQYESSAASMHSATARGSGAGTTTVTISGSTGVNVASNSPGAHQSLVLTTDARRQVLRVADAFEQVMPILELGEVQEQEAHAVIAELRRQGAEDGPGPESGRLRGALHQVRQLAVAGLSIAAGEVIVQAADVALTWAGLG